MKTPHHLLKHIRTMALLLTAALPAVALAQSEVLFIDGGFAELCSEASSTIGTPGSQINITGSRLDIPPLEICNRAIKESADQQDLAASYNNRGVIEFYYKQYQEALADFDKASTLAPQLAATHINKGYVLMVLQRYADSLMAFDKGIALGPPNAAKAYYNRGVAHEQEGHIRDAYYDYLKASELAPDWKEPKEELTRFKVNRK
jgi:tetratricopeptide (TPR) repeat protein